MSTAVYRGAQINFRDLTPYLTYGVSTQTNHPHSLQWPPPYAQSQINENMESFLCWSLTSCKRCILSDTWQTHPRPVLLTLGKICRPVRRKNSLAWRKKSMHSVILIFYKSIWIWEQHTFVHILVKNHNFKYLASSLERKRDKKINFWKSRPLFGSFVKIRQNARHRFFRPLTYLVGSLWVLRPNIWPVGNGNTLPDYKRCKMGSSARVSGTNHVPWRVTLRNIYRPFQSA
jgi:hypothetical protein